MSKPIIGIDLGTTNSLIAVFETGDSRLVENSLGEFLTPSAVTVNKNEVLVGQAAKDRNVSEPLKVATAFKRKMGTHANYVLGKKDQFSAVELSSFVLRKLKEDAEIRLGTTIEDVVISVPAYFNQAQRSATSDAAKLAGLNPIRLINEPTAAALAYGLENIENENMFLVIDLGGGTFDVTLLNMFDGIMEVTASTGDAFLGGEDFTDVLAHLIAEKIGDEWTSLGAELQEQIRARADAAKTHLSRDEKYVVQTMKEGQTHDIEVTRDEFERASKPLLSKILRTIERCIYDSEIDPNDLDRIILVGGATRMPMIRNLVARHLKKFPEFSIDPDHAVALGAAIQAALVTEDKAVEDVVLTDVSPFTVGIETSRDEDGGTRIDGLFTPIIERNTPLPASRESYFSTMVDNQQALRISVYQGEAPMVSENVFIGEFSLNVPRAPKGQEGINLRISYDTSGLIEVDATSGSTGNQKNLVITSNTAGLSKSDIEKRLKFLSNYKTHPREDEENIAVAARLERLYAMATGNDRGYIQNLLIKFKSVVDEQNQAEIEKTRGEILEILKRIDDFYVS